MNLETTNPEKVMDERFKGGTRCPQRVGMGPTHRLGDKPIHHGTSSKRRTSNAQHPMPKFGAEKTNEAGTQERRNGAGVITALNA
jgi:hypothetical protein